MDLDTGSATLLARVDERGVGWVTFNNPARLNALSLEMQLAIPRALAAFDANPDVHVVVLAGAGDKAFVSGADISEFGEKRTSPEARATYDEATERVHRAWDEFTKPLIAMVNGFCIGGGLLTALQADIRICSSNSRFAVPAARLGLGYGFRGVERLVRTVGASWAAEILFSARKLSADEALRAGLVNTVVPREELEPTVRDLAATIAGNAPLTVATCKAAIREVVAASSERDLDVIAAMVEKCFQSEDYLEGQRAFLEKREPQFRGR
jgi:enoyl-CoA hydratase